jgi:thiamine biosynthesis lipoprotein
MTVWHEDHAVAETALDAAFTELDRIENVMSLYRPQSELNRLNRDHVLAAPHPHLVSLLNYAAELSAQSAGAFDVTVQPLWNVYRSAHHRGQLPDENDVREARALVDWRRVHVTPERISLSGDGAAVTLNGIAQGFAVDAAMAALKSAGVAHALLDTGEMGALGARPDGAAWRVGIQHPRRPDAFVSLAQLHDRCLATSGDYETHFSHDLVHHHVFDPRTGHSPTELASVSVAAPTAMAADALSTAVFVLGVRDGTDLMRRTPGADALLIHKDGRIITTEGFPLEA